MTAEIEQAVASWNPASHTAAGTPWAIVGRTADGMAIFVWREQEPCMDVESLQRLYGVTPQQARTAQLLFGRRTNHEISAILGVTLFTARRHVEAVLLKLNASSRFEVESILTRAAAQRLQPGAVLRAERRGAA